MGTGARGRASVGSQGRLAFEPLEPRVMLDGAVVAFPTPLQPLGPLGSLAYSGSDEGLLGAVGETDAFTIDLEAGQMVAVLAKPKGLLDIG